MGDLTLWALAYGVSVGFGVFTLGRSAILIGGCSLAFSYGIVYCMHWYIESGI